MHVCVRACVRACVHRSFECALSWALSCRAGHGKQAASIQGVASHLEHQLAGAKIGHDLKDRESEESLAARGVIHSSAWLVECMLGVQLLS